MASLYVIRGRDVGKHFSLQKNRTRIGRDADNEFRFTIRKCRGITR